MFSQIRSLLPSAPSPSPNPPEVSFSLPIFLNYASSFYFLYFMSCCCRHASFNPPHPSVHDSLPCFHGFQRATWNRYEPFSVSGTLLESCSLLTSFKQAPKKRSSKLFPRSLFCWGGGGWLLPASLKGLILPASPYNPQATATRLNMISNHGSMSSISPHRHRW